MAKDLIQGLVDAAIEQPEPTQDLLDAVEALVMSYADDGAKSGLGIAAQLMGRVGGERGGPARAKSLTPKRRREIARKAAAARWAAPTTGEGETDG